MYVRKVFIAMIICCCFLFLNAYQLAAEGTNPFVSQIEKLFPTQEEIMEAPLGLPPDIEVELDKNNSYIEENEIYALKASVHKVYIIKGFEYLKHVSVENAVKERCLNFEDYLGIKIEVYKNSECAEQTYEGLYDPDNGNEKINVGEKGFINGTFCRFKTGNYLVRIQYSPFCNNVRDTQYRKLMTPDDWMEFKKEIMVYFANLIDSKIKKTARQKENEISVITLRVEKEGFDTWEESVSVESFSPSSITINGKVTDESGNPVANAEIILPEFGKSVKTSADGTYTIKAENEGDKPFVISSKNIVLKKTAVNEKKTMISDLRVEASPSILPVPGSAILKAVVTDNSGKPVEGAKVEISYPENISFVTLDNNGGTTGKNGEFITAINIDKPLLENYSDMNAFPLSLPLEIKVFDQESGSNILTKQFTYPFDMALIKGNTLGPDMKLREEKSPLKLVVNSWRELPLIGTLSNEKGEFYLLVPMSDPDMPSLARLLTTSDLQLMWGDKESPKLIYPLIEKLSAGKVVDVGGIDVLAPEEHETRIKNLVGEFISSMPLKQEAKSLLLKELSNVVFSDGSTREVPVYKKNLISSGGTVSIPGKKEEYWAKCLVNAEDPPYTIMLHELGHFMHLALVEKNYYANVIYNKMIGTMHTTWTTPVPSGVSGWVAPDTQKMFTSFSESAADFFAFLAWEYWQKYHPEIKDSVFFNRGYMEEFDNDSKAMEAISKYLGSQVEGVQTRFLRVFYGNDCIHFPATVYSDYIATMLQYKEDPNNWEGWIYRVPARTIQQWIYAKSNHPSAVGVKVAGDVYNIASRYRMFEGIDPVPTATPASEDGNSEIKHNGKTINFKEFPVAEIEFGKVLEVIKGTINVDISSVNEQRFLYLNEGTSIVIRDRALVEVKKGIVGLKGKVTLKTPKAEITPTGTAVFVEVADDGTTIARVIAGEAVVRAGGTEQSLQEGQKVEVGSNGTLGKIEDFDVETYIKQYLTEPENPFEGGAPPTGLWIVKFIGDVVYYALMILPYLIIAALLYVFWRFVKRFGIKKIIIFIIVLIVIVAAFIYLYMRLFPPLIQDTF